MHKPADSLAPRTRRAPRRPPQSSRKRAKLSNAELVLIRRRAKHFSTIGEDILFGEFYFQLANDVASGRVPHDEISTWQPPKRGVEIARGRAEDACCGGVRSGCGGDGES